jgi:N-acetyl-gamma-glutamyl-phosphate reductase
MTAHVFIDGAAGTTGLEIRERLADRDGLSLITLPEEKRKDAGTRRQALNDADIVVLCLPDDAAREAVSLIGNDRTRVVDASTAHRVAPGWVYGFPELEPDQRERIAAARFVANPGCYPTGYLGLVRPLVRAGLIPADWPLTVNAISGYSGGGKAMITAYEHAGAPDATDTAFRGYAMGLAHKHVPEMQHHAQTLHPPLFAPAVARLYRGMLVEVPLQLRAMPGAPSLEALHDALDAAYAGSPLVRVAPLAESLAAGGIAIEQVGATDRLDLFVFGNREAGQARLVAALDNLGKGAAGAAVQNLNIMAGLDETAGLRL